VIASPNCEFGAEIARNKDVYPTWKENCRVLNQAAKEIERLREEVNRLRRGYCEQTGRQCLGFTATHSRAHKGDPNNKDRMDTRNKEPDSHIQTTGDNRRCNTRRHSRSHIRNANGDAPCGRLLGHRPCQRIAPLPLAYIALRTAPLSVTRLQRQFRWASWPGLPW
jgi:hypothetical protein